MQDRNRSSRDAALGEIVVDEDAPINASGHVQELDRNFSLLSITAVGIVTGNTWAALGGSIVSRAVFTMRPQSDYQYRLSPSTTEVRQESSTSCENASNTLAFFFVGRILISMAIALPSLYFIGSSQPVLLSWPPRFHQAAVSITGQRLRPVDMAAPAVFLLGGGTFSPGSWEELRSQPSLAT